MSRPADLHRLESDAEVMSNTQLQQQIADEPRHPGRDPGHQHPTPATAPSRPRSSSRPSPHYSAWPTVPDAVAAGHQSRSTARRPRPGHRRQHQDTADRQTRPTVMRVARPHGALAVKIRHAAESAPARAEWRTLPAVHGDTTGSMSSPEPSAESGAERASRVRAVPPTTRLRSEVAVDALGWGSKWRRQAVAHRSRSARAAAARWQPAR